MTKILIDLATAQQALNLIERLNAHGWILADFEEEVYASIAALKAALEQQPVQEQENPAMIEWKEKGEEIMAQAGIGFHLGAWWADRPWRQR